MRERFGPRRRPPWWPHNEPWPPRHGQRPRFARRLVLGAFILLALSVTGTASLAWLAAAMLGLAAPPGSRTVAMLAASAAVAIGLLVTALAVITRRFLRPLGRVMDAADRVAAGHYDVQIPEHGSPPMRGLSRAFNAMTRRLQDHDRVPASSWPTSRTSCGRP